MSDRGFATLGDMDVQDFEGQGMSKALVFERRVLLPVSARAAFDWHERVGAFQRLAPPWEAMKVV